MYSVHFCMFSHFSFIILFQFCVDFWMCKVKISGELCSHAVSKHEPGGLKLYMTTKNVLFTGSWLSALFNICKTHRECCRSYKKQEQFLFSSYIEHIQIQENLRIWSELFDIKLLKDSWLSSSSVLLFIHWCALKSLEVCHRCLGEGHI